DQPDGGEVLHSTETDGLHLTQEVRHQPKWVCAADASEDRRAAGDRQYLAGHVEDNLVGVAVRHHAAETAAAGHAEPARVVDDDRVDPAGLGALGAEAGAGAAADDRPAGGNLGAKTLQALHAGEQAHDGGDAPGAGGSASRSQLLTFSCGGAAETPVSCDNGM